MNPFINFTKLIAICAFISSYCHSKPLELWISSFQDQVYYEKMAEVFAKKSKGFEL